MESIPLELRILIVDDVPSARKIIVRLLSKLGLTSFKEAVDGEEALNILRQEEIDLVISDWDMPRLDGISLMKQMRGEDKLKDIPFMLITSAAEKEGVLTAVQSGVSGYILKPFSPQTLETSLRKLLERSQLHRACPDKGG